MRKTALIAALAAGILALSAAPGMAREVTLYSGNPGPDVTTYDEAVTMVGHPVRDLNGVGHGRVKGVSATPAAGLESVTLRNGAVVNASDLEYNKRTGWVIVTVPHEKLAPGY